jgi:hypothetical protein
MNTSTVLEWELHAPGRHITFAARRDDEGFDLVVRRDDTVVFADVAKDTETLLQKSARLRTHLQQLGYSTKPAADWTSRDSGRGAAKAMETSLLNILR